MKKTLTLILILIMCTGCAGFGKKLKSFLRGENPSASSGKRNNTGKRFSEAANYNRGPKRNYSKKSTRNNFGDGSALQQESGSLWVMEGQGGYLFSQNIMRMVGDPLSIKLDGEPKEQLSSKVQVITNLINKLEKRKARARRLAEQKAKEAIEKAKGGDKKKKPQQAQAKPGEKPKDKFQALESSFPVKSVPTRIVERMVDGNYRVKGSQPFMIGKREYRVIVTGIVRAEDFNDTGIESSKLLDSKFDIVSKRRRDRNL